MNMENLKKVISDNAGNGNYFVLEIFNEEITSGQENSDENVLCIYDKDENNIDFINIGEYNYNHVVEILRKNKAEFYINIM